MNVTSVLCPIPSRALTLRRSGVMITALLTWQHTATTTITMHIHTKHNALLIASNTLSNSLMPLSYIRRMYHSYPSLYRHVPIQVDAAAADATKQKQTTTTTPTPSTTTTTTTITESDTANHQPDKFDYASLLMETAGDDSKLRETAPRGDMTAGEYDPSREFITRVERDVEMEKGTSGDKKENNPKKSGRKPKATKDTMKAAVKEKASQLKESVKGAATQMKEGAKEVKEQVEEKVKQILSHEEVVPSTSITAPHEILEVDKPEEAAAQSQSKKVQAGIDALVDADHQEIRSMYTEYLKSVDLEVRRRHAYAIIFLIARHSACEELTLYPFIREDSRIPNAYNIAERSEQEHDKVKRDLKIVDKMNIEDVEYDPILARVMREFSDHASEEEEHVLPLLRAHCQDSELVALGEKFEQSRHIVTTRPHPLAPSHGFSAFLAQLASKPLDIIKDKWEGRDEVVKKVIEDEKKAAEPPITPTIGAERTPAQQQ